MLRLAKNEINFGHYIPLEDIIKGVERVTTEEILDLARELMHADHLGPGGPGPGGRGRLRPGFLGLLKAGGAAAFPPYAAFSLI
jgi:hypothetical protein